MTVRLGLRLGAQPFRHELELFAGNFPFEGAVGLQQPGRKPFAMELSD